MQPYNPAKYIAADHPGLSDSNHFYKSGEEIMKQEITDKSDTIVQMLAQNFNVKHVKSSNSYVCPCPLCGGNDRFCYSPMPVNKPDAISVNGLFYCRQCGFKGHGNYLYDNLMGEKSPAMSQKVKAIHTSSIKGSHFPPFKAIDPQWQEVALDYVQDCVEAVNGNNKAIFEDRGIDVETASLFKLGIHCQLKTRFFKHHASETNQVLEPGIIIPYYRDNQLYHVQVRHFFEEDGKKYSNLSGGNAHPYLLPNNNASLNKFMIVESALDAIMMYQHAGDLIRPIALGSTNNLIDKHVHDLLKNSDLVLLCLDNDEPGQQAAQFHAKVYDQSRIIIPPFGKDPGDYFSMGGNIRDWVQSILHGSPCESTSTSKSQVQVIRSEESAKAYLESVSQCALVALNIFTNPSSKVGFKDKYAAMCFDNNQLALFNMNYLPMKVLKPILSKTVVCFNGVDVLARINVKQNVARNIESIQLMYNALHNIPTKAITLDKLVPLLGLKPLRIPSLTNSKEVIFAELEKVQIIHKLYGYLCPQLTFNDKENLYELMRDAQFAVSEMQKNGILYRENTKGYDPYVSFRDPKTKRLHPQYHIAGTVTGRFSCSKPGLHSVPKDAVTRRRFYAPKGSKYIIGDVNQVQLRIAAIISGDEVMKQVFAEGQDVHLQTAMAVSGKGPEQAMPFRSIGKAINFGFVFQQTAMGLAKCLTEDYGIETSVEEAADHQIAFKEHYAGLAKWMADTKRQALLRNRPTLVKTPSGRIRNLGWYGGDRSSLILNTPIQGGEAEVLLATLIELYSRLEGVDAKLVHVIHDEIILEAAEKDAEKAKDILEQSMIAGMLRIFPSADTTGLVDIRIRKDWQK
ncbi:DNA polymerase [Desulfonatronum parangueonense]